MAASVRRSSTEIGTAYEKHAQRYLNNYLHMSLRRVGGAGDGGVDLRGSWYVPHDAAPGPSRQQGLLAKRGGEAGGTGDREEWRRVRVVGQCKAEKKALGPRAVRELEGVVAHLQGASRKGKERSLSPDQFLDGGGTPSDRSSTSYTDEEQNESEIIAILLSQAGFSKNAMLHALKSHTPLMLVHLPGGHAISGLGMEDDETSEGQEEEAAGAEGVWWNAALSGSPGVLGGKMDLRREILDGGAVDTITGDVRPRVRYVLYHSSKRFKRLGPGEMDDA